MARKLRIQFKGAIYHVINRGNYRRDLFEDSAANLAFENCLIEAAEQFHWRIHAFALMRNHFHLVLEPEDTNLPEGMQWLQVTYALRFNRFRQEQGHLFQGRYRAILVESGFSLVRVVNYVHLNPVEAQVVTPDRITDFRWSSLHHFVRQSAPAVLSSADWLAELRGAGVSGMLEYVSYLQKLAVDREEQKRQGWSGLNHGWAIGTQGWREALAKDYARLAVPRLADAHANTEFRELQWREALAELLRKAGKEPRELAGARKGDPWKIILAQELRHRTAAPHAWIARELKMGAASSVRQYLSQLRRTSYPPSQPTP